MPSFKVHSDFQPAGDQPTAIAALAEGIEAGERFQTLLGITGSGKSATDRLDHREDPAAHPGAGSQQSAGGATGQ